MCMKVRTFWSKRWVSWPNYFRNYWLQNNWLLKRLRCRGSEHHSVMNVLRGSKLLKSAQHHYYPIFPWIRDNLSWKKHALVWSEILRLFVNRLKADYKYSRRNMQIFPQQLQTSYSQKEKAFSGYFITFFKCASNLEHFDEKDEYRGLIVSEIIDSKTVC